MKLLSLLFPLVGLICFVAYVWLVVVAFKKSTLWGLAVLLLSPFAAVALAIKHWQESRTPFLIYSGGAVASLVMLFTLFAGLGGMAMLDAASQMEAGTFTEEDANTLMEDQFDRLQNSGMLDKKEQAHLKQVRQQFDEMQGSNAEAGDESTGSPAIPVLTEAAQVAETAGSVAPASYTSTEPVPALLDPSDIVAGYRAISKTQAGDFLGQYVRIVGRDGKERRGTLVEFGSNTLVLEKHIRAGTFAFEFSTRDVRTIQVAYQ